MKKKLLVEVWRSVYGGVCGGELLVRVNLRNMLSLLTKCTTGGSELASPRGDSCAFCPGRHPYLTHRTYRPLPGHRASSVEDLARDAAEALLLVRLRRPASVLATE